MSPALEKGLGGFILFHAALGCLVAAAMAPEPWSGRFSYLAFPIVTAGALGAAFKYDYVAWLRAPLLLVLSGTLLGSYLGWRSWKHVSSS